ncbi:DDE_3 domain-containing protein [Trichonephila clavipes]|nr:DDE_3 domain-containing protein [Trichonephila clavipes]
MASSISDLNPIEHLWDYLGREVAALNPPPRSLHELKQGLLCVWSSLPIPVSDNLINSMGNRCRQCIQTNSPSDSTDKTFDIGFDTSRDFVMRVPVLQTFRIRPVCSGIVIITDT